MKIVVHKDNLQRAIGFVERVTSKSSTLPILSNILLKTEHGRLRLSATNLEVGISSTIGANVASEGQIAVPGRILADFIRAIKSDTVTLITNGNTLSIEAGSYTTTILSFDAAEYPIIPKVESDTTHLIPADTLRQMFTTVNDSIALSESRPELAGALLKFQTDTTLTAATDSFRLVERRTPLKNTHEATLIIPRTTVAELLRVLSDVQGDITLRIADNQVAFIHDDIEIISRLIDGKYPDYTKIIPERSVSRALVHTAELENAIKIAALFSSSISDIHLTCTEEHLQVTAQNSTKGEVNAGIETNLKGDPFDIAVNYHYFLDGLKVIGTDKVVLEFTGKGSPFVLRPNDEKKEVVYLIMPLRN